MAISFADDARPVRIPQNDFTSVVEFLAANRKAVKSYVIEKGNEKDSYAQLAVDKRQMSAVAKALATPVTIRTEEETLDDGKSVKVWLWAVDAIKRTKAEEKVDEEKADEKTPAQTPETAQKTPVKAAAKPTTAKN